MKLFNIILIPCDFTNDYYLKLKRRMMLHAIWETIKMVFIIALVILFLMEFLPFKKVKKDPQAQAVLHLANMIQLITEDKLTESKMLKYAGLIYQASKRYQVNPVEVIALIMAESRFQEKSINRETGDYGLGQINWEHWGKDYGYTPDELLDPAVNIFLTCHVYKFFEEDFGKYHRGHGIQSKAYLVKVNGILSTLNAFAELNKQNI